ncbi:MAG: cyclodeaminase/cyclohydrolase family protein [Oscillospiraceae bacterium]|nr:cyclodeaminase/cyclohydrolase family protein [Oscillospiraceae bacterium]
MEIKQTELGDYLAALQSRAPTPGGGGAAAVCGALGASLGAMVASLTLGKKKYAAVEADVQKRKDELVAIADVLATLAMLDEQAFAPLAAAYAMPTDTQTQTAEKARVMESALLSACMPPLAMLDAVSRVLGPLRYLAENGSALAVSDAAAGAALCEGALKAAALNVFINTKAMRHREDAALFNEKANSLLATALPAAQALYVDIKAKLDTGAGQPKLLKGAPTAASIGETLQADMEALRAAGVTPALRILRAGAAQDDMAYENSIRRRFQPLGIAVSVEALPADCATAQVLAAVDAAAKDPAVHGILVMRPLPKTVDDAAVCVAVPSEKDVDGVSPACQAAVYAGQDTFAPCTARACVELLDHYGIKLQEKNIAVVGRSLVVGRPLAQLLLRRDATVTVCHTKTKNLRAVCRSADIIVAAAGHSKMIDKSYLSFGQTIVDVGIHADGDTLCGDVDFDSCAPFAAAISPVPGGVGNVTTAVLARAVVQAAKRANES